MTFHDTSLSRPCSAPARPVASVYRTQRILNGDSSLALLQAIDEAGTLGIRGHATHGLDQWRTTVRNPFSRKPAANVRISHPDPCHACTPHDAPPPAADHQASPGESDDAADRSSAGPRITGGELMRSIGLLAAQWAVPAMERLPFA